MKELSNKRKNIYAFIGAVISSAATMTHLGMWTTNILILVFLFAFYFLIKKSFENKSKKVKWISIVVGFVLAAFMTFGKLVVITDRYDGIKSLSYLLLFQVGFWILFSAILVLLYNWLSSLSFVSTKERKQSFFRRLLVFGIISIVILLCWLPYFLADFPANITPDSYSQIKQALGQEPYSNHHPFIHTMFIKFVYNTGLSLFGGNANLAIALYTAVQALLLAFSFAYLLVTMYKFNFKLSVIAVVTAFFALVPYHAIFSMTIWKDVLFGAIILVLTTTLWRISVWYKENKNKFPIYESIMLFVFGVLMCLFRSNGLYAFLVLVAVFAIIFWKKSYIIVFVPVLALAVAFVVKGPVYEKIGVTEPDTIESLSIPAQHISRAVIRGAELSEDDYNLLSQVIDVERIDDEYLPYISDPIKMLVREKDNQAYISENKMEFLKLWIKLGLQDPMAYILAQVDQTVGFWYPDVQYWVYANYIEANDIGMAKDRQTSGEFRGGLFTMVETYKEVPYAGLLWSIGTFTWIIIVMLGYALIKSNFSLAVLFVPVIAILLTLMIATPVHAEFRYAYSIFTTTPLLVCCVFGDKEKE